MAISVSDQDSAIRLADSLAALVHLAEDTPKTSELARDGTKSG